jgi:hypothetical protein
MAFVALAIPGALAGGLALLNREAKARRRFMLS